MRARSQEVDQYVKAAPEQHREALKVLRSLIHEVHPDVEEIIAYKIPAFNVAGEMVANIATRANHVSLYFRSEVVDDHRDKLGKLNVVEGCIRFRKLEQLPMETIRDIIWKSKP